MIDALVDVGIVPDDTPELVTRLMPVIGRVNPTDPATAGVWLTLELR